MHAFVLFLQAENESPLTRALVRPLGECSVKMLLHQKGKSYVRRLQASPS